MAAMVDNVVDSSGKSRGKSSRQKSSQNDSFLRSAQTSQTINAIISSGEGNQLQIGNSTIVVPSNERSTGTQISRFHAGDTLTPSNLPSQRSVETCRNF